MKIDRDMLIRYMEGDLAPADIETIRRELEANERLRLQYERLTELFGLIRSERPDSFAPYFSERVLRRVNQSELQGATPDLFYNSLVWFFPRLSLTCLVLVFAVGAYNVLDSGTLQFSASFWDAVLGLPSTTLKSVLWLG